MNFKEFQFCLCVFLMVFISFTLAQSVKAQDTERPNIIVILADDQGYATMGAQGGDPLRVSTLNLDRFAAEGARFTNAYVTCSTCSPSRAGLITGRYQQRFGYYANFDGQRGTGLPAEEKVFPWYLKQAGYATAAIGKWHLGVALEGQHPLDRGFDYYYGFNSAQTDYFDSPILYKGKIKVDTHAYLTAQFTSEALDFIVKEKENPFFIYLAYNAVHGPNQVPEEYSNRFNHLEKEAHRIQSGMIAALDEGVGMVMGALKENGLDEKTLVIYLNDNGGLPGWWEGSNDPLRGFKREQWEGGNRVIFMMRWPGQIAPGQVRNELIHSLDIGPTALEAAGVPEPVEAAFDGKSLLPLFDESKPSEEIHDMIFWAGSHVDQGRDPSIELPYRKDDAPPAWAVRRGKWKLVQIMEEGDPELFDMEADPLESGDLSYQYPGITAELKNAFIEWFRPMAPPIAWNRKYYDALKCVK